MTALRMAAIPAAGAAAAAATISPAPVLLRRLRPADADALARHLLGLSPRDRRLRFQAGIADAAIRRHVEALDLGALPAWGAFDAASLVGAACGFAAGEAAVEVAVTVAETHRGRGLAAALVAQVCGAAARAGATRAVFEFDPGNTAMQRLVLRFGGRFESLDGRGVVPL